MKIFLRWLTLIVCGWQVMAASQAAAAISLTTFTADESTNGLLVMKGVVEGISENTRAWCEYGWSPYTNIQRTVATNLSQDGNVIFPITDNFVGGRNYYARLMASNSTGVVRGPATPFGWPALSLVGDAVVTNGDFGMYLNGGALATMAPLAIAEGNRYGMILKSDRTCVTWVPPALTISAPSYSFPPGLSNVVAVGGGLQGRGQGAEAQQQAAQLPFGRAQAPGEAQGAPGHQPTGRGQAQHREGREDALLGHGQVGQRGRRLVVEGRAVLRGQAAELVQGPAQAQARDPAQGVAGQALAQGQGTELQGRAVAVIHGHPECRGAG